MAPKRNDPCPCGSGRKYKHCCGRPADRRGGYGPAPVLPPEALAMARKATVWEADLVALPVFIDGKERSRSASTMVVADGIVVLSDMRMVTTTEIQEVAEALEEGVVEAGKVVGHVPETVWVRRREVAEALSPLLLARACQVEETPILDHLDLLVADLAQHLSGHEGWPVVPPPLTWAAWGLPAALVEELFSAYARFYRAAPWTCFHQAPPLFVEWLDGGEPWVVSVLGEVLGEYGMSVYSNVLDFEATLEWDGEELPFQGLEGWMVHLGFQHREEQHRTTVKEVSRAGWEVAEVEAYPYILPVLTPGGGLQSDLVRRLVEVMNGVSAVVEELGEALRSPEGTTFSKTQGRLRLRYFRPGDESAPWEDEDDPWEDAGGLWEEGEDPWEEDLLFPGDDPEDDLLTPEELRSALEKRMGDYNTAPLDELGGISPSQAQDLMIGGVTGEGPLRLSDVLELEEVEASSFLFNARAFLDAADEAGGAPLTRTGNLKRVFVAEMLDRLRLPEGYLADLHRHNKVVNEEDVGLLHVLRVNLELAKLIRKRKGRFHLTRKGRSLMKPDAAGALFRHLFSVHFGEFNLEYPRRRSDAMGLQGAFPLLLWKMSRWARDWVSLEEMTSAILPENIIEAGTGREGYEWKPAMDLYFMILDPLVRFGLLEEARDDLPEDQPHYRWDASAIHLRITPLFRRFLVFSWE